VQGGDVRELDFRFYLGDKKIGAPFHGLRAFFTTPQVRQAWGASCRMAPGMPAGHIQTFRRAASWAWRLACA
jgi:hypothetical protein